VTAAARAAVAAPAANAERQEGYRLMDKERGGHSLGEMLWWRE